MWLVFSKGGNPGDGICTGGAHGYDNLFPDMRAVFMALGPSIKRDVTVKPFLNVEIYEMLAELIRIKPNPNNGTHGSLHHILKQPIKLHDFVMPDPPTVGEVPKDDVEYNYRVNKANCSCAQSKKQTKNADMASNQNLHLPFGVPHSPKDQSTLRLLHHEDFSSAYDLKYRIPMWSSFTLDGKASLVKVDDICWTGDARIPMANTAQCGEYSHPKVQKQYILQRPLYPLGFSEASQQAEASYITNSVPKSMNHTKVLEKKMNDILVKWAAEKALLNVAMGPAFDLSANGLRPEAGKIMKTHDWNGPVTVPTHIFIIATWCSDRVTNFRDCAPSKLQTQAFLLPNAPFPQNCEPGESVINRNVARVVDVEKLTGVSFFTSLPTYEAIRLRTMMPPRSAL